MIQRARFGLSAAVAVSLLCAGASRAQTTGRDTTPAGVLTRWFSHIERNQFDSLPALLSPQFLFDDEPRLDRDAFVRMIAGLGIDRPHVVLSEVRATRQGSGATVTYRRIETFTKAGTAQTGDERGTVVLDHDATGWRIRYWRTY
jgi:hypothetical protein